MQSWWYSLKYQICFLLLNLNVIIVKNIKIILVIIKWLKLFCCHRSYEVLYGDRIYVCNKYGLYSWVYKCYIADMSSTRIVIYLTL